MSKAEEFAYSKYPQSKEGVLYDLARNSIIQGYQQAEKDLELTLKDMAEIVKIANLLEIEWLNSTPWDGIRDWGFYAEVLKRFKLQKGE